MKLRITYFIYYIKLFYLLKRYINLNFRNRYRKSLHYRYTSIVDIDLFSNSCWVTVTKDIYLGTVEKKIANLRMELMFNSFIKNVTIYTVPYLVYDLWTNHDLSLYIKQEDKTFLRNIFKDEDYIKYITKKQKQILQSM